MISQVIRTSLIALGGGFLIELCNGWLESEYLHKFLEENLITILVALLAVNAATMGIVLTKIRDLIDQNNAGSKYFLGVKMQMLLAVKEQIGLIVLGTGLLAVKGAPAVGGL